MNVDALESHLSRWDHEQIKMVEEEIPSSKRQYFSCFGLTGTQCSSQCTSQVTSHFTQTTLSHTESHFTNLCCILSLKEKGKTASIMEIIERKMYQYRYQYHYSSYGTGNWINLWSRGEGVTDRWTRNQVVTVSLPLPYFPLFALLNSKWQQTSSQGTLKRT